jgi:hypothetical protein
MTDDLAARGAHPDLDRLADFHAGLGAGPDADLAQHVQTCAACQQALSALDETQRDLAALDAPGMPSDVSARIEAALAKEQSTADSSADASASTVVPFEGGGRRWRGWVPGAVAAGVIALLIAGVLVNKLASNDKPASTASSTDSAAVAGAAALGVVHATNTNYTAGTIDKQVGALLRLPPTTTATSGQAGSTASGTGGTAATAGSGSGGQLAAPHTESQKAAANAAVPSQLTVLQVSPSAMTQCVGALLGQPPYVTPLAVDIARYNGKPEAVFVFPKANDPAHVRVYVVPPGGCDSGLFDLYKNSVPR